MFIWRGPCRLKTTDHQTVRHPGPTRICRSLSLEIGDCKNPAAEIPAAQFPGPPFDSKRKARCSQKFRPTIPILFRQDLQTQNPTAEITYARLGPERKWAQRRAFQPWCRFRPHRRCRRQNISAPRSKAMVCCFPGIALPQQARQILDIASQIAHLSPRAGQNKRRHQGQRRENQRLDFANSLVSQLPRISRPDFRVGEALRLPRHVVTVVSAPGQAGGGS